MSYEATALGIEEDEPPAETVRVPSMPVPEEALFHGADEDPTIPISPVLVEALLATPAAIPTPEPMFTPLASPAPSPCELEDRRIRRTIIGAWSVTIALFAMLLFLAR